MKSLAYYNGCFCELDEMYIPLNDRGFFFGDGVYEAVYCYNKKIFALDEHLTRFFESIKAMQINLEINYAELKSLIERMVGKVKDERLLVYWQATRGTARRNHSFDRSMKANLCITVRHGELRDMTKPIKVITAPDLRHGYCNIKTLNLLPNVLAFQNAEEQGKQEVIFHRSGRITECAHSNVSILKNGELLTPPSDNMILAGIGRAHLMETCRDLGITVKEQEFYLPDLFAADEIILTAAGSLCISVGEIDGKKTGGKDNVLLSRIRSKLIKEFCDYCCCKESEIYERKQGGD